VDDDICQKSFQYQKNKTIMPMNRIEKILFPSLDRWQRRRQTKTIIAAVLAGLVLSGLVGLVMVLKNSSLH
jgi:hypothetical protein